MQTPIKNIDYKQWIGDLKLRIRQSQIKAAVRVNVELLRLYWDLGHDITVRQMDNVYGSGFFEQLSTDLRAEFPEMEGFSASNVKYCKRFYSFYTQQGEFLQQPVAKLENQNRQQLVDDLQTTDSKSKTNLQQVVANLEDLPIFQIPWAHHIQLFTKCKTVKEALFYVQKTIENGWSRAVLLNFLGAKLYESQGKALNNFARTLPAVIAIWPKKRSKTRTTSIF